MSDLPGTFCGVKIIVNEYALEDTDVRLFPESKHRSARIRKKLIKRFGGEFRKRPCIWKLGDGSFVMHPVMKAKLDAALRPEADNAGGGER